METVAKQAPRRPAR